MPPSAASNAPIAIAIGAGERAAHVAEELALEHARRDGAAVDDDERLLAPRSALHDLHRHELLARAARAFDEHVGAARADALERGEEPAHRERHAVEVAVARLVQ